ncbi:MAG: hypothetical protein ACJ8AO_14015 [Gemmatimonadaceae bacterium]
MPSIEALSDAQAVYSLYEVARQHRGSLRLASRDDASKVVGEALALVMGREQADAIVARLAEEINAPAVARATLASLQESPELLPRVDAQISEVLAAPADSEKLDFGVTLGGYALAALAMALMGTFRWERKDADGGSESVEFQGSEHVVKLVTAILGKIGLA